MKNNILNGIIAPILSLMGALLCLIVAIILFDYHHRGGFHEKMYTCYRVSAIANAIFLFGNIQYLILSTFFKEDDENIGRFFIFYMTFTNFKSHLTSWLEIGFILERVKIFSPKFTHCTRITPNILCLILSLGCILIELYTTLFYVLNSITLPIVSYPFLNNNLFIIMSIFVVKYLFSIVITFCLNILSYKQLSNYHKTKNEVICQKLRLK